MTENDLSNHIRENHKSKRPCVYFRDGRCELDEECGYNHIILKQGEQICFKCGIVFKSKRELINHIREQHGDTIYHRFLRNECKQARCFFSHNILTASAERSQVEVRAYTPTAQDFPSLPTARPVVRAQTVAQSTQDPAQSVPNLSQETQNQIRNMAT